MQDFLFQVQHSGTASLQSQIREVLVSAILAGHLPVEEKVPSTRKMARTLGVSRNTVLLAYLGLVEDGYLKPRNRSGYYVDGKVLEGFVKEPPVQTVESDQEVRLREKFCVHPSKQQNIVKPLGWHNYPYPFIYGQIDHKLFPIVDWRECTRQALGTKRFDVWTEDVRDCDDPMLVEQIRTRILPRRGITASHDEILVTLGAQNALFLLANLLVSNETKVGFEEPGYPDARNIFALRTDRLMPIPLDDQGLVVDDRLDDCNLVFVTPSHQYPTTVTLSRERRMALIEKSRQNNILIVEDDYEFETNFVDRPTPALKSLDTAGNVLYVGSLSKTLFPGLRIGFLVAPKTITQEIRALRRLVVRHPPCNNQRTTALFLALGHHDALVRRIGRSYRARWEEMGRALKTWLPNSSRVPSFGGSSYWVRGPEDLDAGALAERALKKGIIVEPGQVCFSRAPKPKNFLKLGYSSIEIEQIEPGIKLLSRIIEQQTAS